MMNFSRFLWLLCVTAFSAFYVASILYSPDFFSEAGDLTKIHINALVEKAKLPAMIYGAAMFLLFTPAGDFLIGLFLPTRKRSLRDDEKITPAMEIVRRLYKEKHNTDINPKILVMDFPDMNGMAFGRNTIALSSGLLKVADEDEIAAVLAHEAGHLYNKDGLYNVLLLVPLIPLLFITRLCWALVLGSYGILFIVSLAYAHIFTAFWLLSFVVLALHLLLEKLMRWPVEYRADQFALRLGGGAGLISFLERMEDQDIRAKEGFLQKYAYEHPPTALRIDRLERAIIRTANNIMP